MACYRMIAITNASSSAERNKWIERSRDRLRERPPYQLGFGFNEEGYVFPTAPLEECYFFGSPHNKLGEVVQTEERMLECKKKTFIPKIIRDLWQTLCPPTKVGMYVRV